MLVIVKEADNSGSNLPEESVRIGNPSVSTGSASINKESLLE